MKKKHLIIFAALVLFFGWVLVSDALVRWFGVAQVWQYVYNVSFFLICPVVIYRSGWVEYIRNK